MGKVRSRDPTIETERKAPMGVNRKMLPLYPNKCKPLDVPMTPIHLHLASFTPFCQKIKKKRFLLVCSVSYHICLKNVLKRHMKLFHMSFQHIFKTKAIAHSS